MGYVHGKIMMKSKDDASGHPRTGVLVQFLQQQVQERPAIFDGKRVCFFNAYNENLVIQHASFMLLWWLMIFWFSQIELSWCIFLWSQIVNCYALFLFIARTDFQYVNPLSLKNCVAINTMYYYFLFTISINGLLQTMIHIPTRMKRRM